jgi:branched-chain amino acid transport system ATP-binding protein
VLLLDEPSLGLAPLVVKQVFEVIQRINKAGHDGAAGRAERLLGAGHRHRAYVIERGRIALEGDRESLLNNEAVRAAYIGA